MNLLSFNLETYSHVTDKYVVLVTVDLTPTMKNYRSYSSNSLITLW